MNAIEFHRVIAELCRSVGKNCCATQEDRLQTILVDGREPLVTYAAYIADYGYTVACLSPEAAIAEMMLKISGEPAAEPLR